MAIIVRSNPQPGDSFDAVVRNGFDFFRVSIAEFSEKPKYAVIHFCAAVELFLKARLMLEHWTLTLDDPKRADRERFSKGDFKSVSMDEAVRRLASTCGETLSSEDQRTKQATFAVRDDSTDTGVAIAYPDTGTATVTFQLLDKSGALITSEVTKTFAAFNQTALFISELFPNAPSRFTGTMRMTSDQPIVAVALLIQTTSRSLATIPVFPVE